MKSEVPMTALILAGGNSSRMSCDKALLKLGDETILENLAQLTASIFSETFIIASPKKNYQQLDLRGAVILNDFWENKGPMAGLYTGLSYSTNQVICVLTCDMPLVTHGLLRELIAFWEGGYDVVCPKDSDGRLQPFPAIYCRHTRHFIRILLDRGETAMRKIFDVMDIRPLALDKKDSEVLVNMNTQEDYKRILERRSEVSDGITNSFTR